MTLGTPGAGWGRAVSPGAVSPGVVALNDPGDLLVLGWGRAVSPGAVSPGAVAFSDPGDSWCWLGQSYPTGLITPMEQTLEFHTLNYISN